MATSDHELLAPWLVPEQLQSLHNLNASVGITSAVMMSQGAACPKEVCSLRLVWLSWFVTFTIRPWTKGECCEGSVILLIDETGSA